MASFSVRIVPWVTMCVVRSKVIFLTHIQHSHDVFKFKTWDLSSQPCFYLFSFLLSSLELQAVVEFFLVVLSSSFSGIGVGVGTCCCAMSQVLMTVSFV